MMNILSVTPVAVRPPPGRGRSMKRSSLDLLGLIDATAYAVGAAAVETGAWAKSRSAASRMIIPTVRHIVFSCYYNNGRRRAGVQGMEKYGGDDGART